MKPKRHISVVGFFLFLMVGLSWQVGAFDTSVSEIYTDQGLEKTCHGFWAKNYLETDRESLCFRGTISIEYRGATYTGEIYNGVPNGQGTFTHPNGDQYVGEFKNGKFDGLGIQTSLNGRKYVGKFTDHKFDGQGTLTYPDGTKYVGKFKNGKFSGHGTFTYNDGREYVGEFKNGTFDGLGIQTSPTGEKYAGEFKDNRRNGQGTWTHREQLRCPDHLFCRPYVARHTFFHHSK